MYKVTYSYYSYPRLEKLFETAKAARGFFNRLSSDRRVRYIHLEPVEA